MVIWKNKLIRNMIIYLVLVMSYFLLYWINIETMIYQSDDATPKSKVNFIYQQF